MKSLELLLVCRAMFTGELAESRQTEVVIRDIDERAMELLIDFAYTSQVNSSVQIYLAVTTPELQNFDAVLAEVPVLMPLEEK